MNENCKINLYAKAKKANYKISWIRKLGIALVTIALGGITGAVLPALSLETSFALKQAKESMTEKVNPAPLLPESIPIVFEPLKTPEGSSIDPVNTEFSVIIPKIGVNAPVVAAVDPRNPNKYFESLKGGVAHSSLSYFPNEDGIVYLFSHSTNYDWFVRDLNAVFYHLKNLEKGDVIVIFYNAKRYTYSLREKRITGPDEISYMMPMAGKKGLILQTCWPPGSTAERLLLIADPI